LPELWQSPVGWHVHWNPAEKKGYAGTAILSRLPMEVLGTGIDGAEDSDGRVVHAKVGDLQVVSVYLPSGSSGEERQAAKEAWMAEFKPWMDKLCKSKVPVIVGGDLNIAHTENDLFYAKGNRKTSGFMPHECEWFEQTLSSGWADLVRLHFGDVKGPYSWWSNRDKARELDRGWRIDYLLGNPVAAKRFVDASIYRPGGLTVSDHAPVTVNLRDAWWC
ncbi:MAG: exodeoxyribonuclease III, partial [Planctomycetota bacterium]